jgi:hypothetical protein
MGYGIAPMVEITVGEESLIDFLVKDGARRDSIDDMLDALTGKHIQVPLIKSKPIFFEV